MEACGSAHYWGRQLRELGHQVLLLPPHHVARYRQRGRKTDRVDAKALLEAFRNEEITPVPIKSVDQQCLAALHRMRSRWMKTRTACLNLVRGTLREFGLVIPVGANQVAAKVRNWLADEDSLLRCRPSDERRCTPDGTAGGGRDRSADSKVKGEGEVVSFRWMD
jgi:transposase